MSLYVRRRNLWARDPHCAWCGRLTVLASPIPGTITQDDLATVDHLYSRFYPKRRYGYHRHGEERTVLACHRCNQRRSDEECRARPGHGERFARIGRLSLDKPRPHCQSGRSLAHA